MSKNLAVLVSLVLFGCGNGKVEYRFPEKERAPEKIGVPENEALPLPPVEAKLRNTHYYTLFESDYSSTDPKTNKLFDYRGRLLATVSAKFYKNLILEGSAKLVDGRVLNYDGKIGGTHRFKVIRSAWGLGVGTCVLSPFHTIAVDRAVIPLGSTVYIDETKGMKLPDGTLHDGIWRADDVGSAINRDRVDLYVGRRIWNKALDRAKITHLQALHVRILKLPDGESCAYQ